MTSYSQYSYSQCGQDVYAFEKRGKDNCFYIEIGAYDPEDISNTYMLEKMGWNGLSFEGANITSKWYAKRKNKIIICDATNYDFLKCFQENNVPQSIDYLSLDIDDASLDCLQKLPLDKYVFKTITIEHDEYSRGPAMKNAMRKVLFEHGYILDRPDVANYGNIYEDWWIHE